MSVSPQALRRVILYARVSTDDQAERGTQLPQQDELRRAATSAGDVQIVAELFDDVSGTVPFRERRGGGEIYRKAELGLIDEVWVYRYDRLGRDDIDPLLVRRDLGRLGVTVFSLTEGLDSDFIYHIRIAVAAEERRTILQRTKAGMDRAAREGRYTGGIVRFGYRVEGTSNEARLVPADEVVIAAGMTEAGVMRHIYQRLGVDGWSCWDVAEELNALGVPTTYQRDGRGIRGKRTRETWTPGGVRNKVKETIYRGELQYGRRAKKPREVITAEVPAIVSAELWQAAQETLKKNRSRATNTDRVYPLQSVIRCGHCGHKYTGSWIHQASWYRCNGALRRLLGLEQGCSGKMIKGAHLEPLIWADIERWLRDPGSIIEELAEEARGTDPEAEVRRERERLADAIAQRKSERQRLLKLYMRQSISEEEFDAEAGPLDQAVAGLEERLRGLLPAEESLPEVNIPLELLAALRQRLDAGLPPKAQQEIVKLLVRQVTLYTETGEDGKRRVRAVVEYGFPAPEQKGVVHVSTGTGS